MNTTFGRIVRGTLAGSLSMACASALFLTVGASPEAAIAAPALASYEVLIKGGQTWRGDLSDSVEIIVEENGIRHTFTGTVKKVEKDYLVVVTTTAGRTGDRTIFKADLRGMKTLDAGAASGEAPVKGGDASKPADGKTSGASATEPLKTTTVAGPDGKTFLKAPKPGVFVLPLTGTLGTGMRVEEIDAIAKEADKYGPGQTIVFIMDSPGGAVFEGDKISESLKKMKKDHRLVVWIKEAISGGAFVSMHCDEIYFMKVGVCGSVTAFSGGVAFKGAELAAWMDRFASVTEYGGRTGKIARAMIHAPIMLSYDKDPATGKVTWYDTKQGEFLLSDEFDNLTFNSSNALHCGFSDGTADTTEELAKLLQLPEWYEISDVGRKFAKSWTETLELCKSEVPKILARLNFKGSSGDQEEFLGTQIQLLDQLIRWWDRCPNGMMMDIGIMPKDELERRAKDMRKQLADMQKAKRRATSS